MAEVASTFCEDFALQAIAAELPPDAELAFLMEKLDGDMATIFRQSAFYRFEQDLHAAVKTEGMLNADALSTLFSTHLTSYLGPDVQLDQAAADSWVYVSHFFRPFYVYSYVSGLLIAKRIQQLVREDPAQIDAFLDLLASGRQLAPAAACATLNLDLTDPQTWHASLDEVERTLARAEALSLAA
jgi:oligoendopeptidase F